MKMIFPVLSIALPKTLPRLKQEDREYFRAKAERATGRKVEESLKEDLYNENLNKWKSTINGLAESILSSSQVNYANIKIAGILHWLQFILGDEVAFGNDDKLKSWLDNFRDAVKVNKSN
ncbi:hypothetical protein AKO1_002098 [Acrasis kona]|uniref:Glutathione S-transferase UstS-like C-terminal domain-containing protein n=1 Tax=Acrasis kona TaxID=1008807 RepID=A0AAW2YNY1_9EUKA